MPTTSSRLPLGARHVRRTLARTLLLIAALTLVPAQGRAQQDTTHRMNRYIHNIGYGATLGFLYAGVDQLQNDPSEWGKGWPGYGNRLASNVGEFVIQESATEVLAWAMKRPLTYTYCPCTGTTHKMEWAFKSGFTDVLPGDHRVIAVPRILGAYAGSFSQAAWLPGTANRTQTAIVNGTVSLLIGAGINMFHEARSTNGRGGTPPDVAALDRQ